MEKVLHTRLFTFLNDQKLLASHQYGFRPKSNTQTAATEMISQLESWIDEGNCTAAIFIDISKAFNTIKHYILLKKLHYYGICGRTYFLICDYLKNRLQYTVVAGQESEKLPLHWGVIQGGVLAALLFIIYINDMGRLKLNGKLFSYADDTTIIYDEYDAKKIQDDMNFICDYFRINLLLLNAEKTKQMVLQSTRKSTPTVNIHINDSTIERVPEMTYLGLVINDSLSWTNHVESLCGQVSRNVGIVSKLRYKLKTQTMRLTYHSMIQSKLCYMLNEWGSAKELLIKRLATLQNRALKNVFKVPTLHPKETLYRVTAKEILPIRSQYFKSLTTFVHQCVNDEIHHNTQFERLTHSFQTRLRTQDKLKVPRTTTTKYGLESIRYLSTTFYNRIPITITNDTNVNRSL